MGRKKRFFLQLAYPLLLILLLSPAVYIYKNLRQSGWSLTILVLLVRRFFPNTLTVTREDR
jgi:hypothetical protein